MDEVDRGRDHTTDGRRWIKRTVANLEELSIDCIRTARRCVGGLHKVLDGAVGYHRIELLEIFIVEIEIVQ